MSIKKLFLPLLLVGLAGLSRAQDAPTVAAPPPAVPDTTVPADPSVPADAVPGVATPAGAPVVAPPPVTLPAIPALPAITNRLSRSNRLAVPGQFPRSSTISPTGAATPAAAPATGAIAPGGPATRPLITPNPAAPGGTGAPPAVVITETTMTNVTDGTVVKLQKFKNMPLDQFLEIYAKVAGKTVLRPQNLPQVQVSFEPVTSLSRAEILQAYDTVLALNLITMIPTGDKFVTAVQQQQALQEGAAFSALSAGQLPEASQFTTQILQLKNVKPSEIATLLQEFAKNPKAIVAIDPTMTLVLRDYAINVKRMLEVIEKVDIHVEDDYQLEVIPIKYGKVEEIYTSMSGLIGGGGGGGYFPTTGGVGATGVAGAMGAMGSRNRGGMSGMGSRSGSRSFGSGYQSGGAYGSQYNRNTAFQGTTAGGAIGTQGANQNFAGRMGAANRLAGGAGQGTFGVPQLIEDAQIIPDFRSNSLIVYGSKKDIDAIKKVVAKVDTLLAQVLIEAIIMEVKLSDSLLFGVSVGQAPKQFGDTGQGGGAVNNPSDELSGVNRFLQSAGTNGFAVFPTTSGLSYFARLNETWDIAVNAIATDGKANIVQRPRIQTSHGVPGSFFVGETVPFIGGSMNYGGGNYPGSTYVEREDVGVQLTVTPFITPDDLVVMEVEQTIAAVTGSVDIGGGATAPVTSERTAAATLSIRNGDSVLLGGYIQGKADKGRSGVPFLKDLPWIGPIFSSNRRVRDRTEMLVLMRPTILPNPIDAARKATSERDSMPGIMSVDREWNEQEKQLLDEVEGRTNRQKDWGKKKKYVPVEQAPPPNVEPTLINPLGTPVIPPL